MKDTGGTGARRGEQVLQRLRERPPAIWYQGELVKDVTVHPALRGGVHTLAKLYDLQWKDPDVSLYDSPSSGRKVARSFMMPKTREELVSISRAMKVWEDYTHGMMGRVPDYINRAMTATLPELHFSLRRIPGSATTRGVTMSTCARTTSA